MKKGNKNISTFGAEKTVNERFLEIDEVAKAIATKTKSNSDALEEKADLVNGKVPVSQLPADIGLEILEFDNKSKFPVTGESGKIYIDKSKNYQYRWSGTEYIQLESAGIILGETADTAYRGDRGKIAFEHGNKKGNVHDLKKEDLELENVDNTSDENKPISKATQLELGKKLNIDLKNQFNKLLLVPLKTAQSPQNQHAYSDLIISGAFTGVMEFHMSGGFNAIGSYRKIFVLGQGKDGAPNTNETLLERNFSAVSKIYATSGVLFNEVTKKSYIRIYKINKADSNNVNVNLIVHSNVDKLSTDFTITPWVVVTDTSDFPGIEIPKGTGDFVPMDALRKDLKWTTVQKDFFHLNIGDPKRVQILHKHGTPLIFSELTARTTEFQTNYPKDIDLVIPGLKETQLGVLFTPNHWTDQSGNPYNQLYFVVGRQFIRTFSKIKDTEGNYTYTTAVWKEFATTDLINNKLNVDLSNQKGRNILYQKSLPITAKKAYSDIIVEVPNGISSTFIVNLKSSYSGQEASGFYQKEFNLGLSNIGNLWQNFSRVLAVDGTIAKIFLLAPTFVLSEDKKSAYIRIYKNSILNNALTISIQCYATSDLTTNSISVTDWKDIPEGEILPTVDHEQIATKLIIGGISDKKANATLHVEGSSLVKSTTVLGSDNLTDLVKGTALTVKGKVGVTDVVKTSTILDTTKVLTLNTSGVIEHVEASSLKGQGTTIMVDDTEILKQVTELLNG